MTNRVLDLSERPARLSVRNSLLVIRWGHGKGGLGAQADPSAEKTYRCERLGDADETTVPLGDIAVLIVSHPQVSLTQQVLSGLASAGGIFVTCDEKHMPASMLLPLATHSLQAERFAVQASASVPVKKRAWQQIVTAKIEAQACVLEERTGSDWGLRAMASRVRSGDPQNIEAQAARIYWQKLFGGDGFRRDPDGTGLNACLNYGYAVLRAMAARSLCGAGLHPSLGVHHHNRYDAFCLADDLMEPFRPLVDQEVAKLAEGPGKDFPLDRESKAVLLQSLLGRFASDGESRTLFDWLSRSAASLTAVIEQRAERLELPPLERDAAARP